jgi:ribonuclease HI
MVSYKIQFDGGSRGSNPGYAAGAFVLFDSLGEVIASGSKYLPCATNNVAEYTGLIIGLEKCVEMGIENLCIEGDSLLVINQISSKWQVKNENLKLFHKKAIDLLSKIKNIETIRHIYREFNKKADALSTQTILENMSK